MELVAVDAEVGVFRPLLGIIAFGLLLRVQIAISSINSGILFYF
jgi:hypothetical protein